MLVIVRILGKGTLAVAFESSGCGVVPRLRCLQTNKPKCEMGVEGKPSDGLGDIGRTTSAQDADNKVP